MKNQLVILTGKTKKGKDRINTAGSKWLVVNRRTGVWFDDRPGEWLGLRNCTNFLDFRWVKLHDDNDFNVEFAYRPDPNGSDPLERIRNLLTPFMFLVEMVAEGASDNKQEEEIKVQTARNCKKLSKELLDHIENLENMERARVKLKDIQTENT